MNKFKNIICRLAGHQFFRVTSNKLYYIDTCIRCGETRKTYYTTQKTEVKHIKFKA